LERSKLLENHQIRANRFFWRLNTGAELDYIEEYEEHLDGYEFKFNTKIAKAPLSWNNTYPKATFTTINRENWVSFVLKNK
jgi:hypothetical protein